MANRPLRLHPQPSAFRRIAAGTWGDPKDPHEAVRVLRRSVELGVNFFDTADSYGPNVAEELLKEALHPYADDVVIDTDEDEVFGLHGGSPCC